MLKSEKRSRLEDLKDLFRSGLSTGPVGLPLQGVSQTVSAPKLDGAKKGQSGRT